jgi:hypothetical protein
MDVAPRSCAIGVTVNALAWSYLEFSYRLVRWNDEAFFCGRGCHLFAWVLNEQFKYSIWKVTNDGNIAHVFCEWERYYMDVRGVFDKEEIQRCERRIRPISGTTISDLRREFPLANRHGLMWNPLLTCLAKARARRRILRLPDWYNGQNKRRRKVGDWYRAV